MPRLNAEDAAARAASPAARDFSEALARGLEIINAFGPKTPAMTLSDMARAVDLPRATARRSLLTLASLGYVKEEGRLFSLTPRVLLLATAYLGAGPAASILQPLCERLVAECGDTFSVAARDGDSAVMVAYAAPRRLYSDTSGIGLRLPAYCSAVGRVLVAALPEAEQRRYLLRLKPEVFTPRTVTDKRKLRQIFEKVAADGYAVAEEEVEAGYRSLAVPVRRVGGSVVFALNTGMHLDGRSAAALRNRYLPRLLEEARQLEKLLV